MRNPGNWSGNKLSGTKMKVELLIEDKKLLMEADSGAYKSVIQLGLYHSLFRHANFKLRVVTDEQ